MIEVHLVHCVYVWCVFSLAEFLFDVIYGTVATVIKLPEAIQLLPDVG